MRINPGMGFSVVALVAVAGIFARSKVARAMCWVLAVPPLIIGCFALWQGGVTEPFSRQEMLTFCGLAFLPAVGCTIGQLRSRIMPGVTPVQD